MMNNKNLSLREWIEKKQHKDGRELSQGMEHDWHLADGDYVIKHEHPSVEHKSTLISARDFEPTYLKSVMLTSNGLVYCIEGSEKIWTNTGEFNA